MNPKKSHTIDEIKETILEAIAWIDTKWKGKGHRSVLRTLEFCPDLFETNHYTAVQHAVCSRRYELEKLHIRPAASEAGGRVLVYEPDLNLADGLAEGETYGYLDAYNCPPWDTWVGYIQDEEQRYVLAWVPDELVSLINAASEVDCAESFYWLSSSQHSWAKELQNRNSLGHP